MSSDAPAPFGTGELPVPVVLPTALDFPVPPACEAGFTANLRLLEHHWTVLRKARDLIASGVEPA